MYQIIEGFYEFPQSAGQSALIRNEIIRNQSLYKIICAYFSPVRCLKVIYYGKSIRKHKFSKNNFLKIILPKKEPKLYVILSRLMVRNFQFSGQFRGAKHTRLINYIVYYIYFLQICFTQRSIQPASLYLDSKVCMLNHRLEFNCETSIFIVAYVFYLIWSGGLKNFLNKYVFNYD